MTNSDRVRQFFREVWNNDNPAAIEQLMAAEFVGYGLGPPFNGPGGFREFYRPFRAAFDYVKVEIEHTLELGDEVAFRGRAWMSPKGDPKTYEIPGAGFIRYREGMMVSGYNYWDFLSLMTQMGEIPEDLVPRALTAAAAKPADN